MIKYMVDEELIKRAERFDRELCVLTSQLFKNGKLIIKEIKRTGTRKAEIFLIEPTLPRDFKGFIQRLVMIVNEMGAEEVTYEPENNSISFWYD